jgi:hypothetical protein
VTLQNQIASVYDKARTRANRAAALHPYAYVPHTLNYRQGARVMCFWYDPFGGHASVGLEAAALSEWHGLRYGTSLVSVTGSVVIVHCDLAC